MADDNTKELKALNQEQANTNKHLTSVQSSIDAIKVALIGEAQKNPEDVRS